MKYGFPKSRRVLRRWEFRRVYDEGTPYRSAGFHCFVRPREEADAPARLGVTVTKAVGNAVVRNRLKRRVRERFRLWAPEMPAGRDLVVNCRRAALGLSAGEFDRQFAKVLRKAGLLV